MYLKHDSIAWLVACNTQALAAVAMVMAVGLTGQMMWYFLPLSVFCSAENQTQGLGQAT